MSKKIKKKKKSPSTKIRFRKAQFQKDMDMAHALLLEVYDLQRKAEQAVTLISRCVNFLADEASDLRRIRRLTAKQRREGPAAKGSQSAADNEEVPGKSELFRRKAERLSRPVSEG